MPEIDGPKQVQDQPRDQSAGSRIDLYSIYLAELQAARPWDCHNLRINYY